MPNTIPLWANVLSCIFSAAAIIAFVLAFSLWIVKNYQGPDKRAHYKWKRR